MSINCDSSGLMPIEQAQDSVSEITIPITDIQLCFLDQLLDRVLAQDIISPINVPNYDNSAMDGYAIRYQDINNKHLTIVGKSFAGSPYHGSIKAGECVRIMTGAAIPVEADTVIMQENTEHNNDLLTINTAVSKGEAIRKAGSDIQEGSTVLSKGKRLTAIDIGLLASLGIESVNVYRKIKVAVFSTGDELQAQGEASVKYHLYDSNRPMLMAMLQRLGAEVINLGIIKDDKTLIKQAFERADAEADCVITSGGVSVGEADYTREILADIGTINFWKLAIKPGKPLAFGRLQNSLFFGLPGNPVSAAVTFEKIAAPCLRQLAGENTQPLFSLTAKAKQPFRKKTGRVDFQRAICSSDAAGCLWVESSGSQSSGVLSSFSNSNCYVVLESERGNVAVGEEVSIQLFNQ